MHMGESVLVIIEKFRDESAWQDQHLHSPALHWQLSPHLQESFPQFLLVGGFVQPHSGQLHDVCFTSHSGMLVCKSLKHVWLRFQSIQKIQVSPAPLGPQSTIYTNTTTVRSQNTTYSSEIRLPRMIPKSWRAGVLWREESSSRRACRARRAATSHKRRIGFERDLLAQRAGQVPT